jgi:RNA polymerase sigma factor (sigma-70 family)
MRKVLPEEMRRALRKVEPRDRLVLAGRYWADLPRREIAEKTGLTVDAVRWSENRAEKVLKKDKNLWEYWKYFWK